LLAGHRQSPGVGIIGWAAAGAAAIRRRNSNLPQSFASGSHTWFPQADGAPSKPALHFGRFSLTVQHERAFGSSFFSGTGATRSPGRRPKHVAVQTACGDVLLSGVLCKCVGRGDVVLSGVSCGRVGGCGGSNAAGAAQFSRAPVWQAVPRGGGSLGCDRVR
jgi:hypothetical protein